VAVNKITLDALEKVFAAEIDDKLPFQSKAKIYRELEEKGFVVRGKRNFGLVVVEGWYLTHPGRYVYCLNCADGKETPRP
jgi:tRNA splicing endonuclease